MIPEALKFKKVKYQNKGLTITRNSWSHVIKKKNYYYCDIVMDVQSTDLVCVDVHGAPVKRVEVCNGYITLFSNKRPKNFILDIYIFDDDMKVGVSTEDKECKIN